MPGVRDDQQVTGAAVPRYLPCREPDPATQNLNGGFSRILMLIEGRTCGQRDNRLPQHVLVPAEHRLGAAAAGCGTSPLGLLSGDGVQGKLLHASQFPGGCERRATQSEGRPDHTWLDIPVHDRAGRIRHDGGVVTGAPGLYLLGMPVLRTRASTYIHGAAADSDALASHLLSFLGSQR